MATIRPKAVLYSAIEMPCASCCRVAAAGGRLRAEDLDHADHRAQQAQQRRAAAMVPSALR
jgi:3'-phosphoadenosine 5'-phosphosulfate (PAPS) 3'-phosphatase